jgi:hypothetical protein
MKKKILLLAGCMVLSAGTIFTLFALSANLRARPNAFLRIMPPVAVSQKLPFDLGYNSYYIAGGTAHHVYLANFTSPLRMLVVNTANYDTQQVQLNIKDIQKQPFYSVRIKVDSPYFYLIDGTVPIVYTGEVNTWAGEREKFNTAYFGDAVPLRPNEFAIRMMDKESKEYELARERFDTSFLAMAPTLLEKQVDGKFCVDGMMDYDPLSKRFVYVYFYRNEYIVTDSALQLKFRANTIDTTWKARIKVAKVKSKGSTEIAAPPFVVNRHSCVSGKWLFVNSALIARNEVPQDFKKVSVIDVYNLEERKYKFSFYLSHVSFTQLRQFKVFKSKLVALFANDILICDLTPKYFQ